MSEALRILSVIERKAEELQREPSQFRALVHMLRTAVELGCADIPMSRGTLAKAIKTSPTRAQQNLRALEERGEIESRGKKGAPKTNVYRILCAIALLDELGTTSTLPHREAVGASPRAPHHEAVSRWAPHHEAPHHEAPPSEVAENTPPEMVPNVPSKYIEVSSNNIDRCSFLDARPKDFEPELLNQACDRLQQYVAKSHEWRGIDQPAPRPDKYIAARFLAIAEWPKLDQLLWQLWYERKQPGETYGWFLAVAAHRLLGVERDELREAQASRNVIRMRKRSARATDLHHAGDYLKAQIAAAARAKGI